MLGLVATAALLLTVGIFVIRGARQFVASSTWVEHTHDVLTALEHMYATVKDVEADQRGYLLTGRLELEQEYLSNLPAARAAAAAVAKLVADNPEQAARSVQLQELVEKRLQASLETYTTYKTSGFDQARTKVTGGPGIDLMVDCWMAFDVSYAVQFAERMRPYRLRWIEDCLTPENLDAHANLRRRLPWQALATGASVEVAAMQAGLGSARQLRRLWSAHAGGTPGESRSASARL